MKKILLAILAIGFYISTYAQEAILKDGVRYVVKSERVYVNKEDVTDTLSVEKREAILLAYKEKEKELVKIAREKERKRMEKEQKRIEKERKKAGKEQKRTEKAKARFIKAKERHDKARLKYEKLKNRGDLSPNDETKWLNNLYKLKSKLSKAERKL